LKERNMLLTQMVWTKNAETREKDEGILKRYKAVSGKGSI
jgi:hypothetical protein